MILTNLTALIAVTTIRPAPFQNRRSKTQPRDDYRQKTGVAYAVALFYGSLLVENTPPDGNMILPRPQI